MTEVELQKSCRIGDSSKIREILHKNPSLINELDQNLGWSPLYRTITCGHFEASKCLLLLGANPNIKNKLGDSPLHQAVESSQIPLAQLLLDNGADPDIQQSDGDTPLHYSCLKELPQMAHLLLKYRANPNIQDRVFGKTPFDLAAESKNLNILQLMVKYSARSDIEDFSGRTPLDLSEEIKSFIAADRDTDTLSKKTPSFDHSEVSAKADSLVEPEGELGHHVATETFSNFSFGSDPHSSSLYKWLTSMKLEGLFQILHSNGYDDLDFLIAQVRSTDTLTMEILEDIGVKKSGHRAKLMALLEEEAYRETRVAGAARSQVDCIGGRSSKAVTLDKWLEELDLKGVYLNFYNNGYEDIESIMIIMQSNYALTDEILIHSWALQIMKTGRRFLESSKKREKIIIDIRGGFPGFLWRKMSLSLLVSSV